MPELSIVIAVVHGSYSLDSVLQRCLGTDVEIVLVATEEMAFTGVPDFVKFVRAEPGSSERKMRLIGVRQASADRIAVLGDRYDLSDTWMRAALANSTTVSGPVHPPRELSVSGWAIYLAEYTQKCAAVEGNMVYRGDATPVFDPVLSVLLARPPHWKQYLSERYRDSRIWARDQCAASSTPQRLGFAVSRLALPILLLQRRASSRYSWQFLAALPYLLVSGFVETTGEISGFLSGAK